MARVVYGFHRPPDQLFSAYSDTHFLVTTAMVMTVQRQHSHRVSGLLKNCSLTVENLETVSELYEDYDF
jgi:hypothetical protein